MSSVKYTKKEVAEALEKLAKKEESLICERKDINKSIRDVRKNIEIYKQLDFRQLKAF